MVAICCPKREEVEANLVFPFDDAEDVPGLIEIGGESFQVFATPAMVLPVGVRMQVQLVGDDDADVCVSVCRDGRLDCSCEAHRELFPVDGLYCPHVAALVETGVIEPADLAPETAQAANLPF